MLNTVEPKASAHIDIDPGSAVPRRPLPVRLVLIDGGQPRRWNAQVGPGGIDLADLPAGTHTIWIDVPGFAPFTLRDVPLASGWNHLGRILLVRGCSLRILSTARIRAFAWSLRAPSYLRASRGQPTIHGLGPGPHRVVAGHEAGGMALLDRTVVINGEDEIGIDLEHGTSQRIVSQLL